MLTKYQVLLVIFLWLVHLKYHSCGFAKRYKLSIQNIVPCPNNEKLESPLSNVKYVKVNATYGLLSYNVTYKRPIDENVWVHLKLEKFTEQGWVQLPLLPAQKDVCRSSLNSPLMREMWISWSRLTKVAEPDKCPIPAGNYAMEEGLIDMSLIRKVPFWAGKYRVFITEFLHQPDHPIYCLEMNFDSEEVV